MSDQIKFKEFYIQDRFLHLEANEDRLMDEDTHVIEYKAYDVTKKALNLAITQLEYVSNYLNDGHIVNDTIKSLKQVRDL